MKPPLRPPEDVQRLEGAALLHAVAWFRKCMDLEEVGAAADVPVKSKRWHLALSYLKASIEAPRPKAKSGDHPQPELVAWAFEFPGVRAGATRLPASYKP
jgi:hypothetical protein